MRKPTSTVFTASLALVASLLTFVGASTVAIAPAQAADASGAWSSVGGGGEINNQVFTLAQENENGVGTGTIYAGGYFTNVNGDPNVDYIASIDASLTTSWGPLTTGMQTLGAGNGATGVFTIAPARGSAKVYVGGDFNDATTTAGALLWDGSATTFTALGTGLYNTSNYSGVEDIVVVDAANDVIYASGSYLTNAGGQPGLVWRYRPANGWTNSGLTSGDGVHSQLLTSDGSSTYVGGRFTSTPGGTYRHIAQWACAPTNGACSPAAGNFFDVGGGYSSGLGIAGTTNDLVASLAMDGSTTLYAGGRFSALDGSTTAITSGIARFDTFTQTWSSVGPLGGTGIAGSWGSVEAIAFTDNNNDGLNDYMYIGGGFTTVNGQTVNNIAQYDLVTQTWGALTCGAQTGVNAPVRALLPQADGSIIIGGNFTNAGGDPSADYVARYNPAAAQNCTSAGGGGGGSSEPAAGTPSAPQNVKSVLNKNTGEVTISWDPPATDNGSGIVQYMASLADGNAECFAGPSANSCTISPAKMGNYLKPYSEANANQAQDKWTNVNRLDLKQQMLFNAYFRGDQAMVPWANGFYARARNGVGWGAAGYAASHQLDPVLPPGAPTAVVATSGWNKVTVDWTAPADSGTYPVTNYLVASTPDRKVCISTLQDAKLTQCTFTDLTPGTKYTFEVQALNGGGWGEMSAASNTASPLNLKITGYGRKDVKKFLFFKAGSLVTVSGVAPGYAPWTKLYAWYRVGADGDWILSKDAPIVGTDKKYSWERQFDEKLKNNAISVVISAGAPGSKYDPKATYHGAGQNYSNTITTGTDPKKPAAVLDLLHASRSSFTNGREYIHGSLAMQGIADGSVIKVVAINQRTNKKDGFEFTANNASARQGFTITIPDSWKNDAVTLFAQVGNGVKSTSEVLKPQ